MIPARFLLGLLLAGVAADLPAQDLAGNALVVSRSSGAGTQLLRVDLESGDIRSFPAFPGDDASPQAIAWDPITDDAILALDILGIGSRLLRLDFVGSQVVRAKQLALLPGAVRSLEVGYQGDVYAAVQGLQGGIYRIPRNAGPAESVRPMPGSLIMQNPHQLSVAWVVHGSPAQLEMIELSDGQTLQGPFEIPGLNAAEITGFGDLPTGAIRQVISDDQGRIYLFEFLSELREIALSPPLPAGGSVALRMQAHASPVILGGAADPHLRVLDWWTGDLLTIAGPLPGDPVDFAFLPEEFPRVDRFGEICAETGSGLIIWSSEPSLGNSIFRLATRGGAANAPAWLLLGLSSEDYLGFSLPFQLPGSPCSLLVSPDLHFARQTDSTGFAVATLSIPDEPALAGFTFFAQWIQAVPGGVGASEALAVHIFE
ncbi:MAG: hypothetical protein ACYTG5_16930 [Planctomycetota bacterium]|jgi:hypothetical protein